MLRFVIPAQEVMFFFCMKVCLFNPFQREPVLKEIIMFILNYIINYIKSVQLEKGC